MRLPRTTQMLVVGRAWRSLPAKQRDFIIWQARHGKANADPNIALLAALWGQTGWLRQQWEAAGLLAFATVLIVVGGFLAGALEFPYGFFGFMICCGLVLGARLLMVSRSRWAAAVGAANIRAVLESPEHQARLRAAAPAELVVRSPGRLPLALVATFVLGAVTCGFSFSNGFLAVVCAVTLAAIAGFASLISAPLWIRLEPLLPKTMMVVSARGLDLPGLGVRLAWSDVTYVDLMPFNDDPRVPLGIAIGIRDTALPGPPTVVELMLKAEHHIAIPAHWLDAEPAVVLNSIRIHLASGAQHP